MIGFDPGSHNTGFAVLRYVRETDSASIAEIGTFTIDNENPASRIYGMFEQAEKLFKKYNNLNKKFLVTCESFYSTRRLFGADLTPKVIGAIIVASIQGLSGENNWYREVNRSAINKAVCGYGGSNKRKITKNDIRKALETRFDNAIKNKQELTDHSWDALAVCVAAIVKFDFEGK